MFKRSDSVTRGQLVRTELDETVEHARRAAGHAAGRVRETVGPRVAPATERMRQAAAARLASYGVALVPLGEETTRQGAGMAAGALAKGKSLASAARPGGGGGRSSGGGGRSGGRLSRKTAMLLGGVALGALAAYVLRQRRQQQWSEFDAADPLLADEEEEAVIDIHRRDEGGTGDAEPGTGGSSTSTGPSSGTSPSGSASPSGTSPSGSASRGSPSSDSSARHAES